ncbi:tetratricopeptide repeat protein [Flammeovirga sp. EKP202]|uniref:tetratricopeptide repeat protein n=1 Tax=Flammeovirga sp. EKP202 TaxID=2770592 RepID=UPI00165F40BE|nr:tetratricopeptide repeat protein [Flammeovirga sp. EKP202]MBD0404889.1 tetratricopeptide repeat protein [Flammeovirga sp. EKP202]
MKTKQINLLFVILTFFMIGCGPSSLELTNQGKQKLAAGKFKEAVSLFDAAIKEDANNMDAYNARGYAHMSLEEYSKANDDFTLAIELYKQTEDDVPDAYKYFYNRGNVRRITRDPEGAINDYTQAIQLDSTIYDIYLNRAFVNVEVVGLSSALKDFKKAEVLSKGQDKRVFLHQARVLMLTERFEDAILNFDKAIALDDKYAEAYYYKALAISGTTGKADERVCKMLSMAEALGYAQATAALQEYCE